MEQFKSDIAYFDKYRDILVEQYPEEYVAVYNGRVIGSSPKPEGIAEIVAKSKAPETAVVMFMSKKKALTLY
jgi:hypothetical protein